MSAIKWPARALFGVAFVSGLTLSLHGNILARFPSLRSVVHSPTLRRLARVARVGQFLSDFSVTPTGGEATVQSGSTGNSASFTINDYEAPSDTYYDTFDLTCNLSGSVTNCGVPSYVTVERESYADFDATYDATSAGTGSLEVDVNDDTEPGYGYGSYSITVQGYIVASADFDNYDNQLAGLCASSCFTATARQSTVPYFTLDQPRNVTLVYNGDRVAVRPFVYADVSLASGHPASPQHYWLEVYIDGVKMTFINGEQHLYFTVPSNPATTVRLGAQFDGTQYPFSGTGAHAMEVLVGMDYSGSTESKEIDTRIVVVNERSSPIARGWTIAGLQHLYQQYSEAIITDGTGSAADFTPLVGSCYTSPRGDFTKLCTAGSGTSQTFTRSYPDSTKIQFNYLGQETSATDKFGNATSFVYDGSGRLTQIQDPIRTYNGGANKSYIALSYNSGYGLYQIKDPGRDGAPSSDDRVTTFSVGSDSLLASVTDPDGVATRYAYDGNKRLQNIINRRGDTTTFYYGTLWKLDSIQGPRFAVDPRIYGSGQTRRPTTRFVPWQTRGVPTSTTSGNPFTSIVPDSMKATITDAGGHISTFTPDRWGQPVRSVDPLGRVSIIYRNSYPNVMPDSVQNVWGAVDKFTWNGSLLTQLQPAGMNATNYRYNSGYAIADSVWGTGQPSERLYIGQHGRVDSMKVFAGSTTAKTTYGYDSRGRVLTLADPLNHTTQYHYESAYGNQDSTLDPGSRFAKHRFDGLGRDSASTSSAMAWRYTIYDNMNRTLSVRVGHDSTTYTYDSVAVRQVRDALGQVYTFSRNALGLVTAQGDPNTANGSDSSFYDIEGNLTSWINRRGQQVTCSYDALHRPIQKGGTNVVADSLGYSTDGRITVGWNAASRDSIFLGSTGWTDSVVTRFATDPSKRYRVYYHADALRRLDSSSVSTTSSISFTSRHYIWDSASGQLDTVRLGPYTVALGYNGELLNVSRAFAGAQVVASDANTSTHYGYDESFNTTAVDTMLWRGVAYSASNQVSDYYSPLWSATDKYQLHFAYDSLGRINDDTTYQLNFTEECEPGGDPDFGSRLCGQYTSYALGGATLGYDAVGNMTSPGGGGTAAYATGNRLTSWPDGHAYGYDKSGNTIYRKKGTDSTAFSWSADGRLTAVTSGSRTITYDYNAFGKLVRRSVNGTPDHHFLWDGDQFLADLDGTAANRNEEYVWYPGVDNPLALVNSAGTFFYQLDELGNVKGLLTTSGQVYDAVMESDPAWGSPALTVTAYGNDMGRLGWKGLRFEADSTQLYYVRNRWYDPQTRRFVSEDPAGLAGGINLYAFAADDPINLSDPSGMLITDSHGTCTLMGGSCGAKELEDWFDQSWAAGEGGGGYSCYVGGDAGRFQSCMQGAADYLGEAVSVAGSTFVPSYWWDSPFRNGKTVSFAFKERGLFGSPTYNFVAQAGQLVFTKMFGNNEPKWRADGSVTMRFEMQVASNTQNPFIVAGELSPDGTQVYFLRGIANVTITNPLGDNPGLIIEAYVYGAIMRILR